MDPSTYRGLTFLLSLGSLPIACNPEKNDTTEGGTGGGTGTDSAGATTGAATGGTTAITGNESSSNGASDSGPTEGGTGDGTTDGGPGGACASYVAFSVMCDPSLKGMEAQLLADCEAMRKQTAVVRGDACLALGDAYFACLAMSADCSEAACPAETNAFLSCVPEPGEACKAYATTYVACFPDHDPSFIGGLCQSYINFDAFRYGAGCGAANEDYFACLAGLSCGSLKMGTGCEAQQMAIEAACK